MPKRKLTSNPFNVLLILVGAAFAVTALAFGVMTVLAANPQRSQQQMGEARVLWSWLAQHGETLIYVELAVLAVCAAGTIVLDVVTESKSEKSRAAQSARQREPSGESPP